MSLYIQSDGHDLCLWDDTTPPKMLLTEHEADWRLWQHLAATLPTRPETPPEPTDPAVRVRDRFNDEWARVREEWVSPGSSEASWDDLVSEHSPLTIITPDSTAPDNRPLKVGDRVKVADDATWANGEVTNCTERVRGKVCVVVRTEDSDGDCWVNLGCDSREDAAVATHFLTRLPDEATR